MESENAAVVLVKNGDGKGEGGGCGIINRQHASRHELQAEEQQDAIPPTPLV